MGIVTLLIGIAVLVLFYLYDKKNDKVWEAERKMRDRMKQGLPPTEESADNNKKVQILKSQKKKEEDKEDKKEETKDNSENTETPEDSDDDSDSGSDNDDVSEDESDKPKKKKKKK